MRAEGQATYRSRLLNCLGTKMTAWRAVATAAALPEVPLTYALQSSGLRPGARCENKFSECLTNRRTGLTYQHLPTYPL